jgi:hypothetical protein
VTCCVRRETSTAPGPPSRLPCGSAAGTATPGTWPTPSSAWPSWPGMWATGTGQPRCTASRKPVRTGPAIRGKNSPRGIAGTAWTKRAHTWAMSSWTGPTPRAWRSAATRPSTWLSRKPARPDRYRVNRGSSLTGRPGPPAGTVLAFASDTGGHARPLHRVPYRNATVRLLIARQTSGVHDSRLFVRLAAVRVSNRPPSRARLKSEPDHGT